MSFDKRNLITIQASFVDTTTGDPADPISVVFEVKTPDGTVYGYQYGLSDQGSWDASTNTPSLADGTGTAGNYYTVSVAGTQTFDGKSVAFAVGDLVYYNGYVWQRLRNPVGTTPTQVSTGVYTIDQYSGNDGNYHVRTEGLGGPQSAKDETYTIEKGSL